MKRINVNFVFICFTFFTLASYRYFYMVSREPTYYRHKNLIDIHK